MRSVVLVIVSSLVLAACVPQGQQGETGVGFGNYKDYLKEQAARKAVQRGPERTIVPPVTRAPDSGETTTTTVARAEAAPAPVPQPPAPAPTPVAQSPAPVAAEEQTAGQTTEQPAEQPAEQRLARSAISDEQDFEAVSGRETIESDAERIAASRQRYQVIEPGALPERPGDMGPNVVDYALATSHPVGQKIWRRITILSANRFNRNCAGYASSDHAQQDFLARGGPKWDRLGLDPDGDGYACYWDPAPFRAALWANSGN